MILRRIGNKSKLAHKIQQYFPSHEAYIELFFGAGGMFFSKPQAKYNFLNDSDNEIFNLFNVLKERKDELTAAIEFLPENETLFKHYMKVCPTDPIDRAVRFLFLSNFSYMGQSNTISFCCDDNKSQILRKISQAWKMIASAKTMCCDFREMISKINRRDLYKSSPFIYADPPYLQTTDNYQSSFTETDSRDLFDILCNSGIRFAMSEFDHPFILQQAKERNLTVTVIGERQSLKKRSTEILVTNYIPPTQGKLF